MQVNLFRQRLRARTQQIGIWSMLAHSGVLEVMTQSPFDWILIDTEHSPNELPMVQDQLRTVAQSGMSALVRPASNDKTTIKRLLDIGAQSLLIPMVDSVADAERAVQAVRYPPQGVRGVSLATRANGYGTDTAYAHQASERICLALQIESVEGLGALEQIAMVGGVDALFVGPSDLAAALGHLGNVRHPDVQAAIGGALVRTHALGKPIGILMTDPELAERYIADGFDFVAVATDIAMLRAATDAAFRQFHPGARPA